MNTEDKKHAIYCWDSSVFQAWFAEEEDKPLDDIALVIREVESSPNRASLLVSVTCYEEILEIDGNEEPTRKFREYLTRSNVELANVDPRVAEEVARIRVECRRQGIACPKVPDAQIIATALIYRADVIHTFDGGMLKLDRHSIVAGMKICKPIPVSGHQALRSVAKMAVNGQKLNPHLCSLLFRVDRQPWGIPVPHFSAERQLRHA